MLSCHKGVYRLVNYSSINLIRLNHPIQPSNHTRKIASIAKIQALGKPEGQEEEEDDLLSSFTKRRGGRTKKGIQKISPKDWLLSEEGLKFRHPTIGRTNWLGDDIPFPTNPWFKPKPPLSDKGRTKVYESFKQRVHSFMQRNSLQNFSSDEKKRQEQILIRETSEQWGICRDRIFAIIKLKAMEDSWLLNIPTEEAQKNPPDHRRTLQLNFEKGMESVLGVESDQVTRLNEDINELTNRCLERKSKFYGTQFVPIDSPRFEPISSQSTFESASELNPQRPKNKQRYRELDEPSGTRHVIGSDGLPRPFPSYISKPPGKVPMVFTDVSEFPRAPKPISKAKAKYYPKTSLLPDYQAMQSNSSSSTSGRRFTRRSHSTIASSSTDFNQSILNGPQFPRQSIDLGLDSDALQTDQRERIEEEKNNLAFQLLRQLKGCSNSENGLKILDQITTCVEASKFIKLTGVDPDEIKAKLLIQAGGLSFKTRGDTKMILNRDSYHDSNQKNSASTSKINSNETPSYLISKDEKEIQSIKFDMIKSIYIKKLELNSSGRLLLPKSIRTKEEKDSKILHNSSSSKNDTDDSKNTIAIKNNQVGNRSNRLIRQCMKGPLGRIKQRQNLLSSNPSI